MRELAETLRMTDLDERKRELPCVTSRMKRLLRNHKKIFRKKSELDSLPPPEEAATFILRKSGIVYKT